MSDEKDMMLVALMLHDGWKHGLEATAGQYTVAEHPTVCAEWLSNDPELSAILPSEKIEFISGCIASHMGQWNTDYRSKKEILPKPKSAAQKFVHQADLLASRRWLNVDFEDDYYAGPEKEAESEDSIDGDPALGEAISEIVTICKTLIDTKKVKRTDVYKVVSDNNNGNRNPNSIKDVGIATKIKKALEELNG